MKSYIHLIFLVFCVSLSFSCGTSKDTVTSRGMQNLTAKYNIIYNARVMLEESKRTLESATAEDYRQLLSVYHEPSESAAQVIVGNLDSVILKAKTIVDEKVNSKYVDDAYFLIGEANYYKASFFNAAEFFTYVYNTYPDEEVLRQRALVLQARSLLQLDKLEEAKVALDTAFAHIGNSKKTKRSAADVYATRAQYLIDRGKETEAIEMLKKALHAKGVKRNKLRWTYLLAQLQEGNGKHEEAYKNYTSIVKSNAPFNMSFNAGLNRISIEDTKNGETFDKISRLKSLLKNEKNKAFADQIYYRIGDTYLERNQTKEALASFNQAIKSSLNSQNQKGLSYLKIADIYFRQGDYVAAKTYYDSTLASLSPSYPGYDLIRRKGNNLELLASRFRIIGREDTLQMLAKLPQIEREARIGALIREQTEKSSALSLNNQAPDAFIAAIDKPNITAAAVEGKFYFNNTTAISQGLSDFKRRWGNRSLEDHWRRSGKAPTQETLSAAGNPDVSANVTNRQPGAGTPETLIREYTTNLPLSDSALIVSNQRIADSYYDIATFYRDDLKDKSEAIKTFEELLRRVPESSYKLSVYYNLYRLYSDINEDKASYFKNLLLTQYPDSPFAKVIKDPDYAKKTDQIDEALNAAYDNVFVLYTEKKYNEAAFEINKIERRYGRNSLSPQLAYLHALAVGHLQQLPAFETELRKISETFPEDKLITPLVHQHLLYIQNNRQLFENRPTALTEFNAGDPVFIEPAPQPSIAQSSVDEPKVQDIDKRGSESEKISDPVNSVRSDNRQGPPAETHQTQTSHPEAKTVYDLPETAEYYFVINIEEAGANLNSSRFGVGQFNRARFSGSPIKHFLKEVSDTNQLIYVGFFENYASAKYYERSILPLLKDIMKVPVEKYNTFVITKQELDKLTNSAQIKAYLEFYKNN